MARSTIVEEGVRVPMRDGVNILMDVHRPMAEGPHPAILMRSYGRRFGDRNPQLIRDLVDTGYAYVNSEVRGRGGSEGEWRPEQAARVEGPDGYDTIEWLAAQPWCDGNVGMIGAVTGPGILVGPIEQSRVEARPDVLCFTSTPLAEDFEISGPIVVHLWVATSAVDTDFSAKLTHVYPDGQSYNLTEGILRLSGRQLDGLPARVTPGEVYPIEITLGHTSVLVRAGFRLRLQVSSSRFPQYDRNMNTGNPIGTDAVGVRALQTVCHDRDHPSYISLSVDNDGSATTRSRDDDRQ